jgi:TatD DNase family protein
MEELPYINIHTHQPKTADGVVNIFNLMAGQTPQNFTGNDLYFSIGLHPCHIVESKLEAYFDEIESLAQNKNCLAIGETGLDRQTEAPIEIQQSVFERHLSIAAKMNKPLIIHCVKAHSEIIGLIKRNKIDVPVIFHGYNNNQTIAEQVIKHGFYLSFGKAALNENSNAARAISNIPDEFLFLETDDADVSITALYRKVAELKYITVDHLKEIIFENFKRCFTTWK